MLFKKKKKIALDLNQKMKECSEKKIKNKFGLLVNCYSQTFSIFTFKIFLFIFNDLFVHFKNLDISFFFEKNSLKICDKYDYEIIYNFQILLLLCNRAGV